MNSRRTFLAQALSLSIGAMAGGALTAAVHPGAAAAAQAGKAEAAAAQDADASRPFITLPEPDHKRGIPLMEALSLRKSTRKFRATELQLQYVSNILWAAFGVNRPDGKRTIPTARNQQNLIVYAAMQNGVWRYLPETHELIQEVFLNLCELLGNAPLTLGYAAQGEYGGMHAGSAYQNVGLYCASAGLGNVVKATGLNVMAEYITPPPEYKLLILQSVGWPG